jgi:hypothetical protein
MKFHPRHILLLGSLFIAGTVVAQDEPPNPRLNPPHKERPNPRPKERPKQPPKERPNPRPGPGMRPGGGEHGPAFHVPGEGLNKGRRPLDAYMHRLKDNDPATFRGLQRLRNEDPAAFRDRLGQRLNQGRFKDRFKDFPEVGQMMDRLPEDRRREMMRHFMTRNGPGPDNQPSAEALEVRRKNREEMHGKILKLGEAYRAAGNDADRAVVRGQVEQYVTEIFKGRQEERRKHIDRMRKDLGKLEQIMGNDETKRSEMVQGRVDELIARYMNDPQEPQ